MTLTKNRAKEWEHVIEKTSKSRIDRERDDRRSLSLYMVGSDLLKRHNSILLTLNFGRMLTLHEAHQAYERFMGALIEWAGLRESKVTYFGHLYTRNSSGVLWPHAHVIVFSTKDRVTGRSISRIPQQQRDNLQTYWKELVRWDAWPAWMKQKQDGSVNEPFDSQLVYDAGNLVDYLTGHSNMAAWGQRWTRLPAFNLDLLERKLLEKQLRTPTRRAA